MRSNPLTEQQLQNQVNQFNETFKVGDKVEVLKRANGEETFIDEIKHEATIMGGHTAMTWLKGKGSYDLTFVKGKAI
jgi:hypothetical protein